MLLNFRPNLEIVLLSSSCCEFTKVPFNLAVTVNMKVEIRSATLIGIWLILVSHYQYLSGMQGFILDFDLDGEVTVGMGPAAKAF